MKIIMPANNWTIREKIYDAVETGTIKISTPEALVQINKELTNARKSRTVDWHRKNPGEMR